MPLSLSTPSSNDQLDLFLLTPEQIQAYQSLGGFRAVLSVYADAEGKLYNLHPELGFIITFHKIQGRTVPRLILELNPRPFLPHLSFSMLLVALSRVRNSQDIRILPMHAGANLSYLYKLKPDHRLALWQAGYQGGRWAPNTKAMEIDPQVL